MIRQAIRIAIMLLLLWGVYKATGVYALFKFGEYTDRCINVDRMCELSERKASKSEVGAAWSEAMSCVKNKQGFPENMFFDASNSGEESISYHDAKLLCASGRKKLSEQR